MKFNKKSILTASTTSCSSCNKTLLLVLFFLIGTLISCKKEESQYYVKYEINSSNIYYGGKLNVEIVNESNNTISYTINQRELWEITIGPVENGFTANLKAIAAVGSSSHLKLFPSIYVSKDNGPFTLEKTDGSDSFRDEVEISYVIE